MKQPTLNALSEPVTEAAALVVSALGSSLLAVLGLAAEQAALQNVVTGHTVLGLWLLLAGAIALAAAVAVSSRELHPRAERMAAWLRSGGS